MKELVLEYGAPIAVSLTLGVGGLAVTNSQSVAVLEAETDNMVEVQREMIKEIKELNRIVYRIDAKLEVQHE